MRDLLIAAQGVVVPLAPLPHSPAPAPLSGLRVTSLQTGRSRRITAGPCHVLGVVGDVAVFDGQQMGTARLAQADGYAALDLRSGRWQAALRGAPRIRFGKDNTGCDARVG